MVSRSLCFWVTGHREAVLLGLSFSSLTWSFHDTDALALHLTSAQPPTSKLQPMTATLVKSPGYPQEQGAFGRDMRGHFC